MTLIKKKRKKSCTKFKKLNFITCINWYITFVVDDFFQHGWQFSVFWLISFFFGKGQTVLEIRVNLMRFFLRGEVCIFDIEIKKFERILTVNSRKFSVFVKKKDTFTHVPITIRLSSSLLYIYIVSSLAWYITPHFKTSKNYILTVISKWDN